MVLILTLGLLNAASINRNSNLRIWNTLSLGYNKSFVELVEHFLPTILHYLVEAIAAESKMDNIWVRRVSDDVVLAVVIIIEVCRAELIPRK